jgi:tRNA/rRNA methyltransferase
VQISIQISSYSKPSETLMQIHFILVEPKVPENIGAAARALKTMGFSSLRLVNPCDHLHEKAKWLAHASNDILEKATIYSSLSEAVSDIDFIIGTTAKKRSVKHDYHHCNELSSIISAKSKSINNVAIVFGREESGLTNEELKQCDLLSTIPMHRKYPSVNLAQAVMIYTYSLSSLAFTVKKRKEVEPEAAKYLVMKEELEKLLVQSRLSPDFNLYNRILERAALLNDNDLNLFLSLVRRLNNQG